MTKFEVTPELKVLFQKHLDTKVADAILDQEYVSHKNLIDFFTYYRPTESLLQLLQKTRIYRPPKPEVAPKTKEYLKTMQRLQLEQKEKEYQRLVNPSPEFQTLYEPTKGSTISAGQAHKELKSHITTMFNILISVASVVYAIWYWTATSWRLQDSYRVLLCLFFGLLVLVAEVVVYMGYLNRVEEARVRERKKKEIKRVVRHNI